MSLGSDRLVGGPACVWTAAARRWREVVLTDSHLSGLREGALIGDTKGAIASFEYLAVTRAAYERCARWPT